MARGRVAHPLDPWLHVLVGGLAASDVELSVQKDDLASLPSSADGDEGATLVKATIQCLTCLLGVIGMLHDDPAESVLSRQGGQARAGHHSPKRHEEISDRTRRDLKGHPTDVEREVGDFLLGVLERDPGDVVHEIDRGVRDPSIVTSLVLRVHVLVPRDHGWCLRQMKGMGLVNWLLGLLGLLAVSTLTLVLLSLRGGALFLVEGIHLGMCLLSGQRSFELTRVSIALQVNTHLSVISILLLWIRRDL